MRVDLPSFGNRQYQLVSVLAKAINQKLLTNDEHD